MKKDLIYTGHQLVKGATKKNEFSLDLMSEAMPWQMLELEEKTEDWIYWCTDYFEWIGLKQIEKKKKKYIKNRMLAVGILDMSDYTINGDDQHTYLNNMFMEQEFIDPLKKFYPLIPPFINLMKGDFIKRDRTPYVTCIDRQTQSEKLSYKLEIVNQAVIEDAMGKKKESLRKMGIMNPSEEEIQSNPQLSEMRDAFQKEMELEKKLIEAQQKYKNYRHIMEQFGQMVLNKDYQRFNMAHLEEEAFVEMLCNSEMAWEIDMMENDYKVNLIDPSNSFSHQSPSIKYYSEGDYFGYFEEVTIGDIINKDGRRLNKEQLEKLKKQNETIFSYSGIVPKLIPDMFENEHGAYYDSSKKYPGSRVDLNKQHYVKNELIKEILKTNTSLTTNQLQSIYKDDKVDYFAPKLFRRMVLYFRSQKKIGFLVKKNRSGVITFSGWVDENFKITEEAIYDNSLSKEKISENLIYGEHIDWEWVNEWRKVIKLSANHSNPIWNKYNIVDFEPIYIGGDPIETPFKGYEENQFNVDPPFEGFTWKLNGVRPVSFVEILSPYQILTNICINRVPDIIADDIGLALWINQNTLANHNTSGIESQGDPLESALDNLRTKKVLATNVDKAMINQLGNAAPIVPQVLNLSRIEEAEKYLNIAIRLKEMAGEIIGISRQRLAQAKASESATQTQAGINFSEVQTEPLFHQFIVRAMPRVYQKMVEAGTYYAAKFQSAREFYQTTSEGNSYLEIEDNPLRYYSIVVKSDSKERELKQKLENFFLNNNTSDASLLDYVGGLIEDSPSKILENVRLSQIKREEMQDRQHQQEMERLQVSEQAAKERQMLLHQQELELQELKNKGNVETSLVRALGGVQTDANKDGSLDAMQNLQNRISDLQSQIKVNSEKLSLDKEKHKDEMTLKEKELLSKQSIEQKKLAAAIVNANKSTDKKLSDSVAKKQGIK